MSQLNFEQFEGMPSEFLNTLTEKELFETLESGKDAQQKPSQQQNPAPEARQQFFETATDQPQNQNTNVKAGEIISGELAVDLANRIIPVLMALGIERFAGVKVPKKSFELTAGEKSILAPILDRCLSSLNISFENPWVALMTSAAFIYGSKGIDVLNNPELQTPVKKAKETVINKAREANPAPTGQSTRKPGETRGRKPKNF
jgi:hypothetical protein